VARRLDHALRGCSGVLDLPVRVGELQGLRATATEPKEKG
jgi:hypothetical protein